MSLEFLNSVFWEWVAIRLRMGVPMGVVVWGYRGGVGTLRIPYKLSTLGKFRYKAPNHFSSAFPRGAK